MSDGEITVEITETAIEVDIDEVSMDVDLGTSTGGTSDHGGLTGLGDDDHSQYHNDTRGDARYYTQSEVDSALAAKSDATHDHDGSYVPIAGITSGFFDRPQFSYNSSDQIDISPGTYRVIGSGDDIFSWDSDITFQFGPSGSNSGSASMAANTWFYLYIDESSITGATLTAANFIASTTAPTLSDTKRGFYNGNDRCVFACLTNSSSELIEFLHSDDLVYFDEQQETNINATDLDSTWTDCTLIIPSFGDNCRAYVTMQSTYIDGNATLYWRKNGLSSDGHAVGTSRSASYYAQSTFIVISDSSQNIEVMHHLNNGNKAWIWTNAFYLPRGM